MVRLGTRIAFFLLLVAALAVVALQADGQAAPQPATPAAAQPATVPSASAQSATTAHKTRTRARAKKDPVPEVPQPPPPPPTLEQSPPTPPQVSYLNGQLTIDAHNSTLSQVLHAVQSQTGASVEMPAGAGSERVVAQIGPGQPHDVLNTLLNGSKFDYVILGVTGDPGAVQKVILSVRQAGGATPATAQNTPPQPEQTDEDVPVAENQEEYPNQYENQRPAVPGGFRRPILPGQANVPPAAEQQQQQNTYAGPGGEAQNNGGKTPEQLMQELQEMQQQQQQYQEQLNPANREPQ